MSYTKEEQTKTKSLDETNSIIERAIKKVGARKENELCKYIPMSAGGYMHHFTLKKMKRRDPSELSALINRFILGPNEPTSVAPKQRAPRGSRKKKDVPSLSRSHLDQMIALARSAGARDLVALLSPKKSLAAAKKELIQAIKDERIDENLWMNYVDLTNSKKLATS